MRRMSEHRYTPLWKQLLGAATGAIVALLFYAGFAAASPSLSMLTAYLLSDFEEKIENMPKYQQSPRTVRNEAIVWREELGDRARAATARLQKGENFLQEDASSSVSSFSSVAVTVPSVTKEKEEMRKKKDVPRKKGEKRHTEEKRKEEKLPDTGIPFWVIGGVAFCLAMAVRYRKEFLCSPSPCKRVG